ncbi:MAG: hypothetical protein M3Z02_05840 [Actinomycetota bacterium]|nr:hypothetical protein [Actinomycetota bacterium]
MSDVTVEPDPDAIATAATGCSTVAGLSSGAVGEVATYLPGRRVAGVRITEDGVDVHVVGRFGPSMETIGNEVRGAVSAVVSGRQVSVYIDDLEDPPAPAALTAGARKR